MTLPNVATLDRGRAAYADARFGDAYTHLSAADREHALDVDDLERFALAAFVTGHREERSEALARAYQQSVRQKDHVRAARYALWSGYGFADTREYARAEGWFLRANAMIQQNDVDCVERGYLLLALGFKTADGGRGDLAQADDLFGQAVIIGQRFDDLSLVAAGRQARSRSQIHLGHFADGIALLDEALVAVTSGEVSPLFLGNIYCGSIETCKEIFDVRRAQEWTAALARWCDSDPDLVPHRGECLTYRAEIMRLHGAWPDALDELARARNTPGDWVGLGAARYQEGEVHRLRGDSSKAEEAYRASSAAGHDPMPGLALLLLSRGNIDAALAAMRRALDGTPGAVLSARLLPSYIEILLEAKDVAAAAAASAQLQALASDNRSEYLSGIAAHASAAVALANGDATSAVALLRDAWSAYRGIDAPYEAARVRELLGRAYRIQGDAASAEMELDAARVVFEQLQAIPDAERVRERSGPPARGVQGLTTRELEVLALVAKGKTNRAIATDLVISEKTVARHLSNIFDKLGVSSRSALTAFAYDHGLAQPTT